MLGCTGGQYAAISMKVDYVALGDRKMGERRFRECKSIKVRRRSTVRDER